MITEIDLEWPGELRVVHDLAVSPDGRTLVAQVGVGPPGVRLVAWDTTTGRLLNSRPIGRLGVIHLLSDGSLLASVYGISRVGEPPRIIDPVTLDDLHVFDQFDYAAASGDGTRIAMLSQDNECIILDADSRAALHTIDTEPSHTSHVLSETGSRMLTWEGKANPKATVWDTAAGRRLGAIEENAPIRHARFDRAGRRIFTGCMDGSIGVWDADSLNRVATLTGHTKQVIRMEMSRDGSALITASVDGTVRLWNHQTPGQRIAARQRYDAAAARLRPWIQSLFKENGGHAEAVVARVDYDTSLNNRDREIALQMVLKQGVSQHLFDVVWRVGVHEVDFSAVQQAVDVLRACAVTAKQTVLAEDAQIAGLRDGFVGRLRDIIRVGETVRHVATE